MRRSHLVVLDQQSSQLALVGSNPQPSLTSRRSLPRPIKCSSTDTGTANVGTNKGKTGIGCRPYTSFYSIEFH